MDSFYSIILCIIQAFGGDTGTRKSRCWGIMTSYRFTFLWSPRKQNCIALSTSEAEYAEMGKACSDIKSIRILMAEISFTIDRSTALDCDITVAETWAESAASMHHTIPIQLNIFSSKSALFLVPSTSRKLLRKIFGELVHQIVHETRVWDIFPFSVVKLC